MDKKQFKETNRFKEQYGSEIKLYDEQENEHTFHLLLELIDEGNHYVYFQSPDAEEGDIEVLKVIQVENDELDLENIENDEEWERATELFDEATYHFD